MPLRIAINGYGRIGRCFLRALHESPLGEQYRVVAINEPADQRRRAALGDERGGRRPCRLRRPSHRHAGDA